MNLRYYFWQFEGALSKKICNKLFKKALSKKKIKGVTSGFAQNPNIINAQEELKKKRDSHVRWLNDQWYYDILHPYVRAANRNAGWNFEWDWSEPCQVASYKKGQFYGWHRDSFILSPDDKATDDQKNNTMRGKIRKITSVLQLTDPKKYEGGDVRLAPLDSEMEKMDETSGGLFKPNLFTIPKTQGTIFCFPSFVWHRAQPVTKGIRYSVNTWHLGLPFK